MTCILSSGPTLPLRVLSLRKMVPATDGHLDSRAAHFGVGGWIAFDSRFCVVKAG